MSTPVRTIIASKMVSVPPEQSVKHAVDTMVTAHVNTLPVIKDGGFVGLLSERDVIKQVLFQKLDPETTSIQSVMSTKFQSVDQEETLQNCMAMMHKHGSRNLAIVANKKKALGVVSNSDVLGNLINELEMEKKALQEDTQSRVPFEYEPPPPRNRLKELASKQTVMDLPPEETAMEAIQIFASLNIGCALVMENGNLVGVFSERDIVTKVMHPNLKPHHIKMSQVMTPKPVTTEVTASVESCLAQMRKIGCRHLPIMESGKLIGVVSIVDCLKWVHEDTEHYMAQLQEWRNAVVASYSSGF